MPQSAEKPLLTFAVAGFNQEQFIREAVEAAFAQTYARLEIILSDDCSHDRTFEIMQQMAAAYDGPHRVLLNRNPARRSLGGHINQIMEISHGELIIVAAGDDVSLPQRAQLVYEAWEWSGRRATSIHSDIIQIDESGREIAKVYANAGQGGDGRFVTQHNSPLGYVQTLEPLIFGAAHAYSRRLFSVFGDLPEDVIHEDNVLPFRSVLAGGFVYVQQPMVRYRLHGKNLFLREKGLITDVRLLRMEEERVRRDFSNRQRMYEAFLMDLETAGRQGLIGPVEAEKVDAEANQQRDHLRLMREFLEKGFWAKWSTFGRLRRQGFRPGEFRLLLRHLVPAWVLLSLRLARVYARRVWGGLPLGKAGATGKRPSSQCHP